MSRANAKSISSRQRVRPAKSPPRRSRKANAGGPTAAAAMAARRRPSTSSAVVNKRSAVSRDAAVAASPTAIKRGLSGSARDVTKLVRAAAANASGIAPGLDDTRLSANAVASSRSNERIRIAICAWARTSASSPDETPWRTPPSSRAPPAFSVAAAASSPGSPWLNAAETAASARSPRSASGFGKFG